MSRVASRLRLLQVLFVVTVVESFIALGAAVLAFALWTAWDPPAEPAT